MFSDHPKTNVSYTEFVSSFFAFPFEKKKTMFVKKYWKKFLTAEVKYLVYRVIKHAANRFSIKSTLKNKLLLLKKAFFYL